MARYTGPGNKLFRNYGVKELSNRKLTSSMRQTHSGQHGAAKKKLSDYAIHLNEKQKIRLTYLVSEKQFVRYYKNASRKNGVTGTILLQMLESRLDNLLFRAAFVKSVAEMIDMPVSAAWLTVDKDAQKITFDRIPEREELDPDFKEQLVVEYYSK